MGGLTHEELCIVVTRWRCSEFVCCEPAARLNEQLDLPGDSQVKYTRANIFVAFNLRS